MLGPRNVQCTRRRRWRLYALCNGQYRVWWFHCLPHVTRSTNRFVIKTVYNARRLKPQNFALHSIFIGATTFGCDQRWQKVYRRRSANLVAHNPCNDAANEWPAPNSRAHVTHKLCRTHRAQRYIIFHLSNSFIHRSPRNPRTPKQQQQTSDT